MITVRLDAEQLRQQAAHLELGGLFLPAIEPEPTPMSVLEINLVTPMGEAQFKARVVQVMPGAGIGLTFEDAEAGPAAIKALLEAPEAEEAAQEQEAQAKEGDADDSAGTLHEQIRGMSVAEKRHLALHGGRSARLLLLKDTNKQIHAFVLKNPRITSDEVRFIAANRGSSAETLQRIGSTPEWLQHRRIVMALVMNPRTPGPFAVRLMRKLPEMEIRRLSKSNDTPRAVLIAARKKILG